MSKIYPIFRGTIQNGQFVPLPDFNDLFKFYLSTLEKKLVECIIKPIHKRRSLSQNRYYWGVVLQIISEVTEHTPEELHEVFKEKFLNKIEVMGTLIPESTTRISKKEFSEYIDRIRQWALDFLGIQIPAPNEAVDKTEFV